MWRLARKLALLAVLPAALNAQRSSLFGAQFVQSGAGQTTYTCGSTTPVQAALSISCASPDGAITWSGFASAEHGALRAWAHVATTDASSVSPTAWYTLAQTEWSDVAHVAGVGSPSAMFLDLVLSLRGEQRGSVTAQGQFTALCGAISQSYFEVQTPDFDSGQQYANAYSPPECLPAPGAADGINGAPTVDRLTSQQIIVSVPIENGLAPFDYSLYAYAEMYERDPGSISGFADADFAHTMSLEQFVVRDQSGADITADVDVTFEKGTLVSAIEVTPEPSCVTLLASGLLGLGFIGWRRKRGEVQSNA